MVHSWGKEDIEKCRMDDEQYFSQFIDKKVRLIIKSKSPFSGSSTEKELLGRIMRDTYGKPIFMNKGASKQGRHLTLKGSCFEDFYATLTVDDVKEGWK